MHPLYRFLTEQGTNPRFAGAISWNFNKFLIGRDGGIIGRFRTQDEPQSAALREAVEAALGILRTGRVGKPLSDAFFGDLVREKDQAAREKQLAVQSHRNLPALSHGVQLLPGKEEHAFRRGKLAADGMRDAAAGFKCIRVGFIDDPCLRCIHEDPPEAVPHPLAGGALPILPCPDERLFAHISGPCVELLIHFFESDLSSRARSSATSTR